MSDIGKKISDRRKQLGLTLEEVGDAVGVGKSTVRKWENGIIKNMRMDKVKSLANVLQINYSDLIPGVVVPNVRIESNSTPKVLFPPKGSKVAFTKDPNSVETVAEVGFSRPQFQGASIDPETEALLKAWKIAEPDKRKEIVRVVKAMVKED